MRINVMCGMSMARDSYNICGQGTAPAGSSPSSISSKGARGDAVARDGRNHYARERKNGAALGCNRHERKESEGFKSFTYEEITKREKRSIPFERARLP